MNLREYQRLFRASPNAYLILTPDLTIVEVSDAYLRATNTVREEIVGRGLFDIFPGNPDVPEETGTANLAASLRRVIENGRPDAMAVQKYDIPRREGGFEERYWSPLNTPVLGEDGQVGLIVHRVEDVTELIRLKQKGTEHEDEIYRRAQQIQSINEELRTANARLAELDAAKTHFFSNVSHELRTPLTLLLGPVDGLLDAPGELTESQRGQLELVRRNALRLRKHVDSLLAVTRIDAGRMDAHFVPTDLAELTREHAGAFESAHHQAGLSLQLDCPPLSEPVYVDPHLWEMIVLNLVSNAFKFTLEGAVTVTLSEREDEVVLEVCDTGVGIPEEELPRLFERFHRVTATGGRSHEGSGIGLALVRDLVEMHGGQVDVKSTLGEGTTIAVRVPRGSAHLPAERVGERPARIVGGGHAEAYQEEALRWSDDTADPAPVGGAHDGTVLVVDDNPDMRRYLGRLLSGHWTVRTASDGMRALEAARSDPPDLILSDVMMPELDGVSLVAALRAEPATRGVPVVLLTARVGEEATVEGLDAGADDYLVKPFSARELVARVRTHLELALQRRELAEVKAARAAAERLAQRLESLRAISDAALDHLDLDTLLDVMLGRIAAIVHADAVLVTMLGRDGSYESRAAGGRPLDATGLAGQVAAAGRPLPLHAPGLDVVVGVPLLCAGRPAGELYVGRAEPVPLSDEEVQLLQLAAERVAVGIERAGLLDRERNLSEAIQNTLLPQLLPEIPGMDVAAHYRAAAGGREVGGDLYEVVPLADGRVGLAIGDVAGRGARAVALMGQLRNVLRAYAMELGSPAEVLGRLDSVVRSLDETRLVTLLYAVIDLRDWRVHIANAGHLPPLVLAPGGAASFLEVPRGGPLGMVSAEREEVELQLEPGSTLLLYTDGLVQRRGQPLDDGLERLERAAAGLGKGPVPAAICEALAAKLVDHAQSDDAVLLVARLLPPHELLQLELRAVPESLAPMRRELTRWLEAGGVGTGDVGALTLACGEAAANAVEHAYGPDDGTFQMRASRHGDEIAVEIRDRGSWREQRGEDHGRGLILMDALLDSVEVEPGADGTTVLLRKRLGQEQAHGHASVA